MAKSERINESPSAYNAASHKGPFERTIKIKDYPSVDKNGKPITVSRNVIIINVNRPKES